MFKVGDRIAAYEKGCRQIGVIKSITPSGLWVDTGLASSSGVYHPKQLRRLRKKKRREFRLTYSGGAKHFVECKHPCTPADCLGCIHVREVLHAQKAKEPSDE